MFIKQNSKDSSRISSSIADEVFHANAGKIISIIESSPEIGKLNEHERKMILLGLALLLLPQNKQKQKKTFLTELLMIEQLCSKQLPIVKFSIDADQFQIGRKYSPEKFQRFGIILDRNTNKVTVKVAPNSVYNPEDIDLPKLAPEAASYINECHKEGKLVLAILGPARVSGNSTRKIWNISDKAIKKILDRREKKLVILTGGYKGELDGKYGATRAGYDLAKKNGIGSLVIMPKAGEKDSHVNVDVKNIVGDMWGDDTQALITACDAAIVLTPHGLWTEIEVANLTRQDKPFVSIDIEKQSSDQILTLIEQLDSDKRLTPENLETKYNPNFFYFPRQSLRKKPSSQYNLDSGIWEKYDL